MIEVDENTCYVIAPISGKVIELDRVPDPVFSERMTGDGVAVVFDGGEVLAPCDGVISLLFDTKHAFAITADNGIQLLVHVGLDTVILNGEGIEVLHDVGDRVTKGTPVLKINFDLLKENEINLISPILVVNYDKIRDFNICKAGTVVQAGVDTIFSYTPK